MLSWKGLQAPVKALIMAASVGAPWVGLAQPLAVRPAVELGFPTAANNVPAVACAVVLANRIVGLGAVGLRKAGVADAPVTLADVWHHGSLTKSMTATLAAMLVEDGRIQ